MVFNLRSMLCLLLSLCLASPVLAIWPAPTSLKTGDSVLFIKDSLSVTYNGKPLAWSAGYQPEGSDFSGVSIVKGGVSRAMQNILHKNFVPWMLYGRMELQETEPSISSYRTYITHLSITQTGNDTTKIYKPLAGQSDESYTLKVDKKGLATIKASTSTGVLRALESFSQLFFQHSKGPVVYTSLAPVGISDTPEYDHRGILFDVSRSFFPVESLKRTIDAMSWNKLNRIHIHATDSQSWPLEIPSMPELAKEGAYAAGKTFTPRDLATIQEYAIWRGVEAIIEVDSPGHFGSAAFSHPEVIAGWDATPWSAYCAEPPCGQLRLNDPDVVNPFLDKLMEDLLPRISPYSAYFHTGGDEVNFNLYNLDPSVGTNDSAVIVPLLQEFIDKHHDRVRKAGLTPMVWEEIPASYNVTIGKDVVVQSWLGDEAINSLTAQGHKVITSNYNYWYLDCGRGHWLNFENGANFEAYFPFNDWCSPAKGWRLAYSYDPRAGLSEEQAKLVLGGEVAAWSESIDDATIDDILWPRTSAMGEVLWSGRTDGSGQNRSQVEAAPRLAEFRERMMARGVRSASVYMPFCTQAMNGTACEFM